MSGVIVVNGNVVHETDLIREQAEWIVQPRHTDPAVAASRKALLVTAAWREREYDEGHVKDALGAIGIAKRVDEHGYDVARQNLGLFHEMNALFAAAPELRARWEVRERVAQAARAFYLDETAAALARFRRALVQARAHHPALRVADLVGGRAHDLVPVHDEQSLLRRCMTDALSSNLRQLSESDDRMLATLAQLDEHFARESGLRWHPLWRAARARLEERVLSSAAIFVFGGDVQALGAGLRLFALGEVFAEALRRGAALLTVSAGSLVLCERVVVYHQHAGSEFELVDRGLGLVRALQLLPHCMERVQTDDPDNLAYLAYRFHDRACAGLNEGSYLLLDQGEDGTLRARSVGHSDGVYVFDRRGRKVRYDHGAEIPLG